MRIAIEVAGFSPADSDGFRRAMGTWRSTREMEKLHAQFHDGCMRQPGMTEEIAEELFRQVAAFACVRFRQEPRRGVRPDGLRIVVPQAVLPGPVPRRADQRPADGLLPGRGPRQRCEAARGGGPAGRRQPVALQDDDRVGGAAGLGDGERRGRATPRGRGHRAAAGSRPVAVLRHAVDRGPRALGDRRRRRLGRPARVSGSSRGSARSTRRSSIVSWSAARIDHSPTSSSGPAWAEETIERLIRVGALDSLGSATARAPLAAPRGRGIRPRLVSPVGSPAGRWTSGFRRPTRRRSPASPNRSGSAMPTRSSASTPAGRSSRSTGRRWNGSAPSRIRPSPSVARVRSGSVAWSSPASTR